jgi:FkbM family methyltransferase
MLERLRFNLEASGAAAEVTVFPWAAAAASGALKLAAPARNRGAARRAEHGFTVEARPLVDAVKMAGLARVDVLKIDIEGQEGPVLEAFFAAAPRTLWPAAIVIEAGHGDLALPGPAACRHHGYEARATTRMNALLVCANAPGD